MQPELHRTTNAGRSLDGGPALRLFRLAVAVGFEPTEACTSHAFEACSFGRSDTLPPMSLQGAVGALRTVLAEPGGPCDDQVRRAKRGRAVPITATFCQAPERDTP